jgi:Domain of unknown function (DUF397)
MANPDWSWARWRVSSHSGGNGDCVEMTRVDEVNGVRDSKNPYGPVLAFSLHEMRAFLAKAKAGRYDQLVEGT